MKASLVFLKKFTKEETTSWDAAWKAAHAKHDPVFDERRNELCHKHSPRIASAGNSELAELLEALADLGVTRQLPGWRLKPPPTYPRGVVVSEIGKPRWDGMPENKDAKAQAKKLREIFDKRWTEEMEERAGDLLRELRAALRRLDRDHSRALWQDVRTALDYPVFTAAPELVGITSTGSEGPSQFPEVLAAYRQFRSWVDAGAKGSEKPTHT